MGKFHPESADLTVVQSAQSVADELIPTTGEGWGGRRKEMTISAVKLIWEAEKIAKNHQLEINTRNEQEGQDAA
jgi:hypothetical protein